MRDRIAFAGLHGCGVERLQLGADLLEPITHWRIQRRRRSAGGPRRVGRTDQGSQIGFDQQVAAAPASLPVGTRLGGVRRRAARILQQVIARELVEVLLQGRQALRRIGFGRRCYLVQQPARLFQTLLRCLGAGRPGYQQCREQHHHVSRHR